MKIQTKYFTYECGKIVIIDDEIPNPRPYDEILLSYIIDQVKLPVGKEYYYCDQFPNLYRVDGCSYSSLTYRGSLPQNVTWTKTSEELIHEVYEQFRNKFEDRLRRLGYTG